MSLIPWRRKRDTREEREQPEKSLARLHEGMDSLFDRFLRDPWGCGESESFVSELMKLPRTDLADTENDVIVTMELPGVDPTDVDISIAGDVLTVRGEKKEEKTQKGKNLRHVERQHGRFQRSVRLPGTVDSATADATFKNGVLSVSIVKNPQAKPKRITVRNG